MIGTTLRITVVLVAIGAILTAWDVARAEEKKDDDEKKLTIDQVPAAVKATILKEAGKNEIKEIEEEIEDGQRVYGAEWVADGKEVDIKVAPDGTLLKKEVEEDKDADKEDKDEEDDDEKVTIDQVPAAVKATILKEAGENKIEEIEAEKEDGKTVYEAKWHVGGKEIEIKVGPDGTLLKKEVEEDKEEDDGDNNDDNDKDD